MWPEVEDMSSPPLYGVMEEEAAALSRHGLEH
jgi:hypothetical protein